MDNIQIINNGDEQWVIIDRGNGEFTSMSKDTYDAQITANQAMSNA